MYRCVALAAHEVEVSSVITKALEGLATTSVPKQLLKITKLLVKPADVLNVWDDSAQFVCYSYLAYAAWSYHTLARYAGDLNVSLKPTVAPAIEAGDLLRDTSPHLLGARVGHDQTQFPQTPRAGARGSSAHASTGRS